jgi:putative MATE family efflux protein
MSQKVISLTEGSLRKNIFIFSLPLMCTNLLQVLFNMADVAVVGQFVGSHALGAVGSTSLLIALYTGFLIGVASGMNIIVALAVGAGKEKDIRETVHTSALIALFCGLVLLVIGISSAGLILELMKTKPELLKAAVLYMRIYLLGMPALALYNFGNAVFSAVGNTRKPLIFLAISGVVNVILNLFFVIVCGMEVEGVALASILSQYLSAFLVLRGLLKTEEAYGLRREYLKISKDKAIRVLRIGLPSGLQNAIFYIANLFVQMGVNSFDATMVAGNSAAMNADTLIYDMMAAFYTACGSFMGQNYGAKKRDRILKSYLWCVFYAFAIAAVFGAVMELFGTQFLSILSSDKAVIEAGMLRIRIMGFSYCVSAFMDASIAAARSLGKSLVPTIIVIMGSCIFRVAWIYTVFAYFGTTTSLYLLYIFSFGITALAGNLYFAGVYRRKMRELS